MSGGKGPGGDGCAEEIDRYSVAGGDGGVDGVVGDVDDGLGNGGGDGDGGGLVLAVHGLEVGVEFGLKLWREVDRRGGRGVVRVKYFSNPASRRS